MAVERTVHEELQRVTARSKTLAGHLKDANRKLVMARQALEFYGNPQARRPGAPPWTTDTGELARETLARIR